MTPGQHLHALWSAHFNGAGWADPPLWEDFDEEGHARWEANAKAIGENIRMALAAPALLKAIEPFAEASTHLHPSQPDDGLTLDGVEVRHWRAAAAAAFNARGGQ